MTSFHALFSIGMALGAWCGALFVKLQVTLFYHLVVAIVISLIAVAWATRNLVHDKPDATLKHDGPLFRLPTMSLLGIGLIAFCCMVGEGSMGDWSVNYLLNVAHASRAAAPLGLSAFASAMTIGRIFGDKVRVILGDRKLIVLGGVIAITGLGIALLVPLPWIAIAGFFLVGLGLSTIVPIAYSLAGNAEGLPSGVGLAMVTTVGYTGFLFGPPVIGFLADWQTLRIALVFVLALLFIMTVLGLRHKVGGQR
jgi:fucose permease